MTDIDGKGVWGWRLRSPTSVHRFRAETSRRVSAHEMRASYAHLNGATLLCDGGGVGNAQRCSPTAKRRAQAWNAPREAERNTGRPDQRAGDQCRSFLEMEGKAELLAAKRNDHLVCVGRCLLDVDDAANVRMRKQGMRPEKCCLHCGE